METERKMVYAYLRVSTDEQGDSGLGLEAQRRTLTDWFTRDLAGDRLRWIEEVASAKDVEHRPELCNVLGLLRPGDTIAVSKMDRLTRSVVDFGQLLEAAKDGGWYIVGLDLGVDTSTPTGELIANIMVSVSQWERRIIGQRTKEALAERRAAGQTLGRPTEASEEAISAIRELAQIADGPGYIARKLHEADIAPPRGDVWHRSTVARIMARERIEPYGNDAA